MEAHSLFLDLVVSALLVGGGFFLLMAGLGILRLPDVLIRMHASTKAGTLGAGMVFTAVALHSGNTVTISICALTVSFLLVTAPVAAHAIARAAYRMRVPLWRKTRLDEWKGQYGPRRKPALTEEPGEVPPETGG